MSDPSEQDKPAVPSGEEPRATPPAETVSARSSAPASPGSEQPAPRDAGAPRQEGQGDHAQPGASQSGGPQTPGQAQPQPMRQGVGPQQAGAQGAPAQPEVWTDIHLEDIVKGFGVLFGLVTGAVEAVGSAFQGPSYTRPVNTAAPAKLGAGALLAGVRDPVVELFDEGGEIMLIVEWPYVAEEQITVEARDDILCLSIDGEYPYETEILLPGCVEPTPLSRSYRNGILEVRLRRI